MTRNIIRKIAHRPYTFPPLEYGGETYLHDDDDDTLLVDDTGTLELVDD